MIWKEKLKKGICNIEQLVKYIDLTKKEQRQLKKIIKKHPIKITEYYLSLIDRNDPNDPIKKMVIPSIGEFDLTGSYDTSDEQKNTKMPGLQHKYAQTALILLTNRCSTYCRYCFRKRLVGLSKEEILHKLNDAVKYIKKHHEINNVLVTGGDPFVLSTKIIKTTLESLLTIPHLNFIRFGTKIPVTFPDRIIEDKDLVDLLKKSSKKDKRLYIVTHFNHPREITKKSIDAIGKLISSGLIINNQMVLLKDVNDNAEIISGLQNKLVEIGVNPYYIFQCRPVKRVKKTFQVPLYRGYYIIEKAKQNLHGLSKRFKYVMAHKTGKIEVVGIFENEICFKYHQAESQKNSGKFFKKKINKTAGWLDDLK